MLRLGLPHSAAASLALAFAILLLSPAPSAEAQQAHEPPPEAMTLFESARNHYRNGEYTAAATDLENALVLDPSAPTLLFNLGRVYELMGRLDDSISAYRRLMAVTPADQAEERERTQAVIDRLEGAREHHVAAPPPPPQEAGEAERGPTFVRERGVADTAFWATFAAGGVVGLAAIGCGIGGLLVHSNADAFVVGWDGTYDDREFIYAQSRDLGMAADVLGGIGTATMIAAGLLFILREHTYESWTASLSVTPQGGMLVVGGQF